MKIKKLNLLLLLFLLVIPCACSSPPPPPPGSVADAAAVQVVVTRDFGRETILDEKVILSVPTSALEALKQVAQVETAYGGGFVRGINGTSSQFRGAASSKKDWFVFINGMLANTGALDYTLQTGDIMQWDYHTWSFHQSVPAITGSFPQPFSGGYAGQIRPASIVYGEDFREQGNSLKQTLTGSGVQNVKLIGIAGLNAKDKQEDNLILIGAADDSLVIELNRNWRRLGFFAYLENSRLVTLTASGQPADTYGAGTGWIQAVQNPWNPNGIGADENVVWLVTGTDQAGVKAAAARLTTGNVELKYTCAAVIAGDQVVRLPR
jgi:hypothetical protein